MGGKLLHYALEDPGRCTLACTGDCRQHNKNVRNMQGQGTGLFSGEEIAAFRREIWESVDGLVSAAYAQHRDREGPFWVWGGDAPTEADAVLFGFVVSGLVCGA